MLDSIVCIDDSIIEVQAKTIEDLTNEYYKLSDVSVKLSTNLETCTQDLVDTQYKIQNRTIIMYGSIGLNVLILMMILL